MKRSVRKKGSTSNKRDKKGNEKYSVSLPLDLVIAILTKLPLKSIANLMFVSKLWYSEIRKKHFTDLFLARSLTRPCFLITSCNDNRFFHSASYEALSSLDHYSTTCTLTYEYRMTQPTRGLICGQDGSKMVICNPSTGQVVDLPNVKTRRRGISSFLGYDSIKDKYKVLCMTVLLKVSYDHEPVVSGEHQVFTFGDVKKRWRMIECKVPHCPATKELFMNEIVYYGAWSNSLRESSFIVAFDVKLEEFSLIKLPEDVRIRSHDRSDLVNYHKKVALVDQTLCGELDLWVLEDVEKRKWSKIYVVVPSWKDLVGKALFHCMGTISTGELVFAPDCPHYLNKLFMVYYDVKEEHARRVEIERFGDPLAGAKTIFLDYVENPMFL